MEVIVSKLKVQCINDNKGCTWLGELRNLEAHLENCDYLEIPCTNENCKEKVQQRNLEDHKKNCLYRTILCDHCWKNYAFIHQKEHEENCEKQPLQCVHKCAETIARDKMEKHLDEECENTINRCKYCKIGCPGKGTQSWLEKHEETAIKNHLSQAVDKLEECKIRIIQQNDRLSDQNKKIEIITEKLNYLYSLSSKSPKPFLCSINDFETKFKRAKQDNDYIFSDPFYCLDGYRARLQLHLNGYGDGRGSHVSACFRIMKGPFDDVLDWPFKGNVRLSVQGNAEKKEVKREFDTTKVTQEDIDRLFQRPKSELNDGRGYPYFIKHEGMEDYIKDNCLTTICHVEQVR